LPCDSRRFTSRVRYAAPAHKQINFDENANLTAIFKARAKVQLGKDGDTLTGTIKVEFFDPNGVLFLTGNGTLSGRRMRLD
jgi:hypothetical protein